MNNTLNNNEKEQYYGEKMNNNELVIIKKDNDPRFDLTALSDSTFKRMLMYYDQISTAPTEFLLTSSLASLSGAIGKNVFFEINPTITIFLNVWAVNIGPSSIGRKTTAIDLATSELQNISTQEYKSFLDAKEANEKQQKENPNLPILKIPQRNFILFPNDSTAESLSEILSISQRGLMLYSEFGSFLAQLNRNYAGDSKQFLTAIYDVPKSHEITRATKANKLIIRPYLSILGGSTIEWIKSNSSKDDLFSGFFARFLYAIRNNPDKAYKPFLELKSIEKETHCSVDIRSVYDRLVAIRDPTKLELSKEAIDLHISYDIENHNEMLKLENNTELPFKVRLIIYALKFAGIIAIADNRTTVTKEDMADALLIADYYKKNIEKLLNKDICETDFQRNEQKILRIISKEERIKHSVLLNRSNLSAGYMNKIIEDLEQKEKINVEYEITGKGKPTRYYSLSA